MADLNACILQWSYRSCFHVNLETESTDEAIFYLFKEESGHKKKKNSKSERPQGASVLLLPIPPW